MTAESQQALVLANNDEEPPVFHATFQLRVVVANMHKHT